MTETAPAYGPQTGVHLDLADQIVELTEHLDAYLARPGAPPPADRPFLHFDACLARMDCDPAVCEMLTIAIDIIDALLAEERA